MISDWIGLVREGVRFRALHEDAVATVSMRDCAVLPLSSGAFVLEDIGCVREDESFGAYHLNLSPGLWPVRMAVLDLREGTSLFPEGLVCPFCCIFGDLDPVVVWRPAPGEQPFVQCDRGLVCAFDLSDRPLFGSDLLADDDVYFSRMDQAGQEMFSLVMDGGRLAMVVFYAGLGAGSYPVWLGLNEADQIVCVVVDARAMEDFEVVSESPG